VESDQDVIEFFMPGSDLRHSMLTKLQRSYEVIAQIRQQTSASLIAQVERNFLQFQKHP
jgi:hypothetical protein